MELTFDVESMRHLAIVSDSTQQRATGFGTDSQTYHDVGTRLESHRFGDAVCWVPHRKGIGPARRPLGRNLTGHLD